MDHEGYKIVHQTDLAWEDRINVDGWPCRASDFCQDPEHDLYFVMVNYPVGAVEPRHVHAATHATTVVKGRALIDDLTLQPLDVILGSIDFPAGATVLSVTMR